MKYKKLHKLDGFVKTVQNIFQFYTDKKTIEVRRDTGIESTDFFF